MRGLPGMGTECDRGWSSSMMLNEVFKSLSPSLAHYITIIQTFFKNIF